MDSRSGIGAGLYGHLRAAAVVGAVTAATLMVAGCASHHVPAGAEASAPGLAAVAPLSTEDLPGLPASAAVATPSTAGSQSLAASAPQTANEATAPLAVLPASSAAPALPPTAASSVAEIYVGAATNVPSASPAAKVVGLNAERDSKSILMAAYESKLQHDRAVVSAYRRERRRQPALAHATDRSYFLRRMLQDGLMRLSEPELLAWAQLQRSVMDRGGSGICLKVHSPQDAPGFNQTMSINALSVDEVAQYLNLSYQAIHDAAVGKPFRSPSKWRVQAAQINLAAQVVALIAQHPEDAKRLAIFEAEGEKKSTANRCWMAVLGMRAALRLRDPDRDIILRTLVKRDAE